ncbi:MAG TPA: thiamine pyrophosphate-dependent enzyme [Rhodoblastus sp.]|nr:thiamine pyrophosphate-dependent enzyme [Rhodoblastus sp.]
MDLISACKIIEATRRKSVLVSTMGAMFAFDLLGAAQPRMSSVPLMGGAASLGLGIAIAAPSHRVVVVDGDASLLMQLGGLVTVADRRPTNFFHFVIRNGTQFTGVSNLSVPAEASVDFAAMAAAAGYRATFRFDDLDQFAAEAEKLFAREGPVFVELRVPPLPGTPGRPVDFELPDQQFQRMGLEARALSSWLKDNPHG